MGEKKDQATLRIGELAKRFGLNTKTLRYYEEIGLLPVGARTAESGYRLYSEADAERLAFVLKAKGVGFSLEEIREVLRLGQHGQACPYVRETLARRIAEVERQIVQMQSLRAELLKAQAAWDGQDIGGGGLICGLIEEVRSFSSDMNRRNQITKNQVTKNQESNPMADSRKRQVEVFTAGCPLCDPVVKLVRRVACDGCEVTVHDLRDNPEATQRLKAAGIERVPAVLVDGKPAECCSSSSAVTEEGLRAAGVGAG